MPAILRNVMARACWCLLLLQAVAACVMEHYYEEPPIVGWTCTPTYGGCGEYGTPQSLATATVGWPFEWWLLAGCTTGNWSLERVELATGRLPPGLEFGGDRGHDIVGTPTRAGSFSFTVTFHGASCPGSAYMPYGDFTGWYTIEVRGN